MQTNTTACLHCFNLHRVVRKILMYSYFWLFKTKTERDGIKILKEKSTVKIFKLNLAIIN